MMVTVMSLQVKLIGQSCTFCANQKCVVLQVRSSLFKSDATEDDQLIYGFVEGL